MALELELEEVVGDLGSALARKHKHLVPAHGHWEVAAGRRDLSTLSDLKHTAAHPISVFPAALFS